MNKERRLIFIMIEAHDRNRWLSMVKIIEWTKMSSFNQRFQEWRKLGIEVENKMVGNESFYKLKTNPETIDWDIMKARLPGNRIARTGKKVEKIEAQEILL